MDQDNGSKIPLRPGISRLSRLPMPRSVASTDNLRLTARSATAPVIHHDDLRKNSTLPRPAGAKGPLGDNLNQSIRTRYAWTDNSNRPRSVSPVRDALRDAYNASMDTTPPGSDSHVPVFEEGNENPTVSKGDPAQEVKDKRRPRPSLSERTIETLSQISPCPSPVPRRQSVAGNDNTMAPPFRPASSMKNSRPTTPASRPESPSKRPFRPPGRLSPTKDIGVLPPVVSPGDIYTPPKAFVRGQQSRIAKLPHELRRPVSTAFGTTDEKFGSVRSSTAAGPTMRSKPTYGSKTISSHSSTTKPSLASIFKDVPTTQSTTAGKLAISNPDQRTTLLRPKTRGENAIAPSTPPSGQPKKHKPATKADNIAPTPSTSGVESRDSPKSSAALRDTIAKAKAAKRKAIESSKDAPIQRSSEHSWPVVEIEDQVTPGGDSKGLLRKRIQQAVTSGHLNISRMALKRMPPEITTMYESDNSTVNWSEMTDLIKLNMADNEIEQLGPEIFPDYSPADLTNDDEKTNQFGALEHIDLHRNLLFQIPIGIRRLERLQTLNLSNNKLTNKALEVVSQMTSLKELLISDNLLSGALDFGDHRLENLQILDVHGNEIQTLQVESFSAFKGLKTINCASNKITALPWDTLEALPLTDFNASKNRLSGRLFEGSLRLEGLRNLDVSHNSLEDIGDSKLALSSLRSLTINGNRLLRLPDLSGCASLHTLLASENQLEELPANFVELKLLRSADFAYNNIRIIDAEIALMEELSSLTLVGNPLREKKYLTMSTTEIKQDAERKLEVQHGDDAAVAGSTRVPSVNGVQRYRYKQSNGVLDLSTQSLGTINIDEIDLDNSTVPIHTLKLSNNDLSAFPFDLLSHPKLKDSLQSLDLSHNPLLHPTQYLTSELFLPSLKSLYIVSTGLTSLDALTTYLKAPTLAELNISCHRLAGHVPWVRAWWPNCVTLLATDNWFNSIDTEGVRGLEVLDIRNNEIENLPAKIGLLGNFVGSAREPGRLRVLEVSGNKFRVPRLAVIEKGSEAVLRDLRRMVPEHDVPDEWKDMV